MGALFEAAERGAGGEYKAAHGVLLFPAGKLGSLRSERSYKNFHLHVEWRWSDGTGNSGVFVDQKEPDLLWPLSIQVSLKAGVAGELLAQDTMKFAGGSENPGHCFFRKIGWRME